MISENTLSVSNLISNSRRGSPFVQLKVHDKPQTTSDQSIKLVSKAGNLERKDLQQINSSKSHNEELLKSIQEELNLINNIELKFNRDIETNQTYIKIIDKDTGDVIREIPPKELRKLAEKMEEMAGILFDKKA